jgi:hypothetical protein
VPCGSDPEPSCVALQDYYDDCCATCGEEDSYCLFDDLDESEAYCDEQLDFWDISECVCD